MSYPKTYAELYEWVVTYKVKHPHERLGQAFLNEFSDSLGVLIEDESVLFYEENEHVAFHMIGAGLCAKVGADNFYGVYE